jgi:hypothetical protein
MILAKPTEAKIPYELNARKKTGSINLIILNTKFFNSTYLAERYAIKILSSNVFADNATMKSIKKTV